MRDKAIEGMRPTPATDPTNPYHQEATGVEVVNEYAAEVANAEPGLTDCDRDERDLGVRRYG